MNRSGFTWFWRTSCANNTISMTFKVKVLSDLSFSFQIMILALLLCHRQAIVTTRHDLDRTLHLEESAAYADNKQTQLITRLVHSFINTMALQKAD
mmetsp:Transcript_33253/g.80396  ORF Transcript_33253/g.80396 Transcript_33253/m.80396 type:complete len:96 (+) Transcript_33253:117-404(+)